MSKKTGFFWHFFFNFDGFWSLCLLEAILAQKENSFICRKKNVIFWHPWDPWGRVNSGKKFFGVQTASVSSKHLVAFAARLAGCINEHAFVEVFFRLPLPSFLPPLGNSRVLSLSIPSNGRLFPLLRTLALSVYPREWGEKGNYWHPSIPWF